MKAQLDIIYEDESIIAVNKPAGLATVNERNAREGLAQSLSSQSGQKIFTVHRLDKETTGVILFAKNPDAHRELSIQFEKREITKTYLALAEGVLKVDEGRITYKLSPEPKNSFKMRIDEKKGKPSVTLFTVEKRFQNYTLLKVIPQTGRMHQVRIHLAAFGHPVVCDSLYGNKNPIYLSHIKRHYRFKEDRQEKPLLLRLALHACRLEFFHPVSKEKLIIEAELPKDFRLTLNNLERYSLLFE